mgnify:CR=1 FL=1
MRTALRKVFLLCTSVPSMMLVAALLGTACGVATFAENNWGTQAAHADVYGAWWFSGLLLLLALSAVGNIIRRRWWRIDRWPSGLIHAGVAVILLGAALTKHGGHRGFVHIREGETASSFLSERPYLTLSVGKGQERLSRRQAAFFSPRKKPHLKGRMPAGGSQLVWNALRFIPDAAPTIVPDPAEGPALLLTAVEGASRRLVPLRPGQHTELGHVVFVYEASTADSLPVVHIAGRGDSLRFRSSQPVAQVAMRDTTASLLEAERDHLLQPLQLYAVGGVKFALRTYLPHARIAAIPADQVQPAVDEQDLSQALELEVKLGTERRVLSLFGGAGTPGEPQTLILGGLQVTLQFGSIGLQMPFGLRLKDFVIERYPGSDRPSMFISKLEVVDPEHGPQQPVEVFMNQPLRYRGYRFYQASYDDDERGTLLNVAVDPGTPVVYAGFALLTCGLLGWVIAPLRRRPRATGAVRRPGVVHAMAIGMTAIVALATTFVALRPDAGGGKQAHLLAFARLPVLDADGRFKPLDTFAREIVQKVAHAPQVEGRAAGEVLLGMMTRPDQWRYVPMIHVDDARIRQLLGLRSGQERARFVDFIDGDGRYRLVEQLHAVQRKPAAALDRRDRQLLRLDERTSICYLIFRGLLPRLFPDQEQPARWLSYTQAQRELKEAEAGEVRELYEAYLQAVRRAEQDAWWSGADRALQRIRAYQHRYARALMPPEARLRTEILLNRLMPFQRLLFVYLALGIGVLSLALVSTVRGQVPAATIVQGVRAALLTAFLLHTGGLALRWYASGHAPWSNAYEATVYIAWAAALAGVVLSRRSLWLPAATSLLAAATLFVAHLSGMDPQITPLVPVLKSKWLVIHVSTITASYGFLGLGALVALLSLALQAFAPARANLRLRAAVTELSSDVRRLLRLGFVLLNVGTIFGAIWANASWGRYWGWDAKETWTLVTILTYTVILHLRQVPRLAGEMLFSVAAVLGFGSVLMTYFGVNYYLTGLHSYAQGERLSWPPLAYVALAATIALVATASLRRALTRKGNTGAPGKK